LPAELAEERTCDYRHRLTLDAEDPYQYRYRRSRRYALSRGVWQRQIFCWIAFRRQLVGALNLWQFVALPHTNSHDFFEAMDAYSLATAMLGELLATSWREVTWFFDCGPVIEFRLAWVAPGIANRARWAVAAEALIEREFGELYAAKGLAGMVFRRPSLPMRS
jgi:hypothetical protein